jgi:ABC-type Fe3+-hydroxamate transport system substrate-binding protein
MRFTRALAIAALALLGALRDASADRITVVDAIGRQVEVGAPAQRVVILFNYEEFLATAGPTAFDHVVDSKTVWYDWRRSIYERYVAAIPRIASLADVGLSYDGTFSTEKVISLKPDAIIMPRWAFDTLGAAVAQFAEASIPTVVIDYNAMRVETHVASTLAIGRVMGTESRAEELAAFYRARVEDVVARIKRAGKPRPKIYVELGHFGADTYGSSFAADQWGPLIGTAGGDNIANGQISSEAPLSPEYVLASNPDFIFIAGSNWTNAPKAVEMGFGIDRALTVARLKPYLDRPGWRDMAAVRSGHVYAIHHGIARTLFDFAGMQFIAKAMYPEAFADVDPEASLRQFFATYLPVTYDGTWMTRLAP